MHDSHVRINARRTCVYISTVFTCTRTYTVTPKRTRAHLQTLIALYRLPTQTFYYTIRDGGVHVHARGGV